MKQLQKALVYVTYFITSCSRVAVFLCGELWLYYLWVLSGQTSQKMADRLTGFSGDVICNLCRCLHLLEHPITLAAETART